MKSDRRQGWGGGGGGLREGRDYDVLSAARKVERTLRGRMCVRLRELTRFAP